MVHLRDLNEPLADGWRTPGSTVQDAEMQAMLACVRWAADLSTESSAESPTLAPTTLECGSALSLTLVVRSLSGERA